MNLKRRQLLICIAIPLAVGGVSAWLSQERMNTFAVFDKPPLSPPGWLFPVVWTLLFVLMGLATYLVLMSAQPQQAINRALRLYGIQLGVNFFWSIFFFNLIIISVLFPLAHPFMASHFSNHRTVLSHFPDSRVSNASIFVMGRICRVSKFGYLSAELKDRLSNDAPSMKHHLLLFRATKMPYCSIFLS